jgi:hypothetical protein
MALSHIQFVGLVDSAGGLEEQGFQWSSPQTINPVGLETEESKTEGGAFRCECAAFACHDQPAAAFARENGRCGRRLAS